jgi:hypothetical protein
MNGSRVRLHLLAICLSAAIAVFGYAPVQVIAQGEQPPPGTPFTEIGDIGACGGCRVYRWNHPVTDEPCEYYLCIYGGWPACGSEVKPEHLCPAGRVYEAQQCTGIGVQTCSATCSADGQSLSPWTCGGTVNIGSLTRNYCDYDAGCPVTSGGYVQGRPVERQMICSYLSGISTIETRGACGEGLCQGKLVCAKNGACNCPPGGCAQCTPRAAAAPQNLTPVCAPTAGGYTCSYGQATATLALPCPSVVRKPFPRAIVGQPVEMGIGDACDASSASSEIQVPASDPDQWGTCNAETVIGYRATLNWDCTDPNSAAWVMDERDFNIGQTGSDGRTILNQRTGGAITHVYETSSHDKEVNGPGYPDLGARQPAYQVQVKTRWTLRGQFAYQVRRTEQRCTDINGNARQCGVDTDIAITRTVVISPWIDAPAIVIPGIEIDGARTPQDPTHAQTCTVIPVPVIQSQAVIVR